MKSCFVYSSFVQMFISRFHEYPLDCVDFFPNWFFRGRTYSTHCEVLVLVLGVEPEPNLGVVL